MKMFASAFLRISMLCQHARTSSDTFVIMHVRACVWVSAGWYLKRLFTLTQVPDAVNRQNFRQRRHTAPACRFIRARANTHTHARGAKRRDERCFYSDLWKIAFQRDVKHKPTHESLRKREPTQTTNCALTKWTISITWQLYINQLNCDQSCILEAHNFGWKLLKC